MQPNNHMQRNNPWGFQAQNWSQPMTRGPSPHQHQRPNINRFGSPPGQRPNFQPRGFNQHMGSPRQGIDVQSPRMGLQQQGMSPGMSHGQPRFQNNQPFHGNQSQFQGPYHQQQNIQGPRPNQHPGQMFNRPPNRPMAGPPPDFFRAPGNHQQRPRFQKGRHQGDKKKIDKRDLPENNRFYCDSCDRGYKDEDKYKLHLDQHQKCPKEGCTYVAAGKLVQLHIKLHHNTGLAKKIWSLESQEDIQKWIDERKKNFPTAENIEKKKAIQAERIARGEVIEEKYFGKMHRREDNKRGGRGRGRGRDRGRGRGNNRGDANQQNDMKRKLNDTDTDGCTVQKQAKEGTSEDNVMRESAESLSMFFAADSSDSDSSDSDEDDNNKSVKKVTGSTSSTVPDVTAAGALGNLMSTYVVSDESGDEDDTEKPDNVPIKKSSANTSEPSVVPSVSKGEQNNNDNDNKKFRQRNRGRQKKNKDKWNPPPKLDKSLLEKLLAKEIRQERNKIMQCVHYIVKNNFFDKPQNTENKT